MGIARQFAEVLLADVEVVGMLGTRLGIRDASGSYLDSKDLHHYSRGTGFPFRMSRLALGLRLGLLDPIARYHEHPKYTK